MSGRIDFCGTRLNPSPRGNGEHMYMGPDPDALLDYFRNAGSYNYTHFEDPHVLRVPPEQVGGICLSRYDLADPAGFWSAHRKDGTYGSFRAVAGDIPDVAALLDAGAGIESIPCQSRLRACADLYFRRPADIPVVDMGTFYLFQSNGRHGPRMPDPRIHRRVHGPPGVTAPYRNIGG